MTEFEDLSESDSSFTTTSSTGRVLGTWISKSAAKWSEEKDRGEGAAEHKFVVPEPEFSPDYKFSEKGETQYPPRQTRSLTPTEAITEASLTVLVDHLREDRSDGRKRAYEVWRWMIRFGVLAGLLVFAGGILWLFGMVEPAGIVAVNGVASGGGGFGIFWNIYRGEKQEIKNIRRDLQFFDSRRLGLILATQISDSEERDRRIGDLMDELARVRAAGDHDSLTADE